MLPQNKSWKEFKFERKILDCENATFNKYGKEIKIHDYIQEGRAGTIAKEIIQKAGGFDVLKNQMDRINTGLDSELTIDLNMDLMEVNRKIKMGKMAEKKIEEEKKLQEKLNQIQQQETNKKEQKKDGNE